MRILRAEDERFPARPLVKVFEKNYYSVGQSHFPSFSPSGGAVVIQLTKQDSTLPFRVYNTASSTITKEILNHVFDRFYCADPSTNSETEGYGIGGKIHATSTDGRFFHLSGIFLN